MRLFLKAIDFCFDFASPYGSIATMQIDGLLRDRLARSYGARPHGLKPMTMNNPRQRMGAEFIGVCCQCLWQRTADHSRLGFEWH